MKKILGSTKGAVALALAVALFGTTAYGAETASATNTTQIQAEQQTSVLTYEDALAKAKKHSVSLADLQKSNDLLAETKEDLWDEVGSFSIPTYDYQKWVDADVYAYTSGVYSVDSGLKKNKYSAQITNLMLEVTLKTTFASIVESEANLKLLKESSAIQKTLYEQGQTKLQLGMLSQYKLDKLKVDYEKSGVDIYQLETGLDQMYMNLNNLMGEASDKKYTLEYNVDFEPYVLQTTIETYINAAMNSDYSILLKEKAVEDAKFSQNYLSESTPNSTNKANKLTYDTARRALKAAKEDKDVDIRNAYVQLQQSEVNYKQAETDLAQLQADLKTAQVNYQAGNVTKIVLEQAQLAITKQELYLEKLARTYDMQVFAFKNTSLITGGSSSSGGSKESAES